MWNIFAERELYHEADRYHAISSNDPAWRAVVVMADFSAKCFARAVGVDLPEAFFSHSSYSRSTVRGVHATQPDASRREQERVFDLERTACFGYSEPLANRQRPKNFMPRKRQRRPKPPCRCI
jgi:hypothetical protein